MRFPSIKDVSSEIRGIVRYPELADPENEDHEGNWMDVRLQIWNDGSWNIHTGDSQYDQDHRGFWGATSIPMIGRFDSRETAKELLEQAREDAWQSGED
jgi:hypothetical protein